VATGVAMMAGILSGAAGGIQISAIEVRRAWPSE
jgi:hypothetical protein